MHLHALIVHLEKIEKMNPRLKASSYAQFLARTQNVEGN